MSCLSFLKKRAIQSAKDRDTAFAERCKKAFYDRFGCWVDFSVRGGSSAIAIVEGLEIYAGNVRGTIVFHEYGSCWPRELNTIQDLGDAFIMLEKKKCN